MLRQGQMENGIVAVWSPESKSIDITKPLLATVTKRNGAQKKSKGQDKFIFLGADNN